jgi:hypothetical protein
MQEAVDVVMRVSQTRIDRFDSQHLSNLCWSLARLMSSNNKTATTTTTTTINSINRNNINRNNRNDPSLEQYTQLLRAIGMQLADQKRSVTSQGISNTLWSLSTLGFRDDSIYRNLATNHSTWPIRYGPWRRLNLR